MKQIPFTQYEAIILLDGYLQKLETGVPMNRIVLQVSNDLRKMAVNSGMIIDDTYRSKKGISYQIRCMEAAYQGKQSSVPIPKLFADTVVLYNTDRRMYDTKLEEARSMIKNKISHKDDFLGGASSALPVKRQKWIKADIGTVDLNNVPSMAYTRPYRVLFRGEMLALPQTWKDVYVSIVEALYQDYPQAFEGLQSLFNHPRLEFCSEIEKESLVAPRRVNENFYVETNFSATDIVKRIAMLMDICNISYDNAVIQYQKKEDSTPVRDISTESSIKSSDSEAVFRNYLIKEAGLAERTSFTYISSIKSAERFAREHGYSSCSLFNDDKEIVLETVSKLYSDTEFLQCNVDQHRRFSAAINKLLESIGESVSLDSCSAPKKQQLHNVQADSGVVKILQTHYKYGFKYDSLRELMRFRLFADAMDISLPDDDDYLKEIILASGIIFEDKVYCKSVNLPKELQAIVDEITLSGVEVIYYEKLLCYQSEWMTTHVITSEDMLKECLKTYVPGFSFSKKFMTIGRKRTEKDAVSDEIRRVWGEPVSRSVSFLDESLPYIPLDNIWRVISGNDSFVLVSEGEYLLLDHFHITEDEEEDILEYVEDACREHGFASLTDVPLGYIEEVNFELSKHAIYNAVYKKVLAGRYHLNGKILTKDNSDLDAVSLLKEYLIDRETCSFDEITERVVSLTGGCYRQYAFQALYDTMVRVDRDHYVSDRLVDFDVEEVDRVLSGFITDHFRAIRDVTTFAMFPVCGQNWNHYLLESYCYKYSKKYSLQVIHFNSKNAGIITEKGFNKPYNEMLSIALARTDIPLTLDSVGWYLFNTGYLAKSKYVKLEDIINQATLMRQER